MMGRFIPDARPAYTLRKGGSGYTRGCLIYAEDMPDPAVWSHGPHLPSRLRDDFELRKASNSARFPVDDRIIDKHNNPSSAKPSAR